MSPPLGIWIDDRPGLVVGGGYLEGLRDLGISTIAVMVETSISAWDPIWSLTRLGEVCKRAIDLDMEVVLTTWPSPRRRYLEEMTEWLDDALQLGASGLEVDLEGQWRSSRLDGTIASLEGAAVSLIEDLEILSRENDVRLEVTTHTGHQESSARALVAPHIDRFVAQAYSIRIRPDGTVVSWDDRRLGPGHHQRWVVADARTVPGVADGMPALAIGLPLWGQHWPGREASESLQLAYDAALEANPVEVRFWSSKHLLGVAKKPYGAEWLSSLSRCA